jgi:type III restriction enzyme
MIAQFQYTRLAHQACAVQSIAGVFADVRFIEPPNVQANPTFVPYDADKAIKANITRIRADNQVTAGPVVVPGTATPALNLDVLMETGTGKTFTLIETIHRLFKDHRVAKFLVLVPSNAIRQGTLKSLQTTAAFFAKEYKNQHINVFNYSDKTVRGFIHAANQGISVMVATYQSFAGDSKTINKRGVEANLFGHAKSYMEALAAIRPVLIIDEPHRFEGKQTQEYLAKFNPLLTIRFGATFKNDEYKNLIYTLDSLEAFRQRLVKGITVDTVGTGADMAQVLCLTQVSGTAKERVGQVSYQTAAGKTATAEMRVKDNLGSVTGLRFLDGHVVETLSTKELVFTNGFALPLAEPTSYGMLADAVQSLLIERSVANHFEREEALFKRGIKSISLFFIDSVAKYLPEGSKPAAVRNAFERHYRLQLAAILAKDGLDAHYKAYLERSAADIGRVHKGYFARSHSEKGEEEAIKLILQEKEKLLSFDTDLRFIFSMWALQEGWDNPNIFTLCKLAPSNSKITKLQQIGRGLRLAVNQQLERVQADDAAFDEVNDLMVVVPASEGDFVASIQNEIAAHSVGKVAQVVSQESLAASGVGMNPFVTVALFQALAQCGAGDLDRATGTLRLNADGDRFKREREAIEKVLTTVAGLDADKRKAMMGYLDAYYQGAGQVKRKQDKPTVQLTVRPDQYQNFKALWDNLNRDAVLHYQLDTEALIAKVLASIERNFSVKALSIGVTRTQGVENIHRANSTQASYDIKPHSVYTLSEFVRELANMTRLSLHTVSDIVCQMSADQFAQIQYNENRALTTLRDLIVRCIHELLVNKVRYELREVKVITALTDRKGQLVKTVPASLGGKEMHAISNAQVLARSLYEEALMPVDSVIERTTTDESHQSSVTVFAKLPKINIPTPLGNYNPDFGYCLHKDGLAQTLYLVVETKGYDSRQEIPDPEQWKIESAKQFFNALKDYGVTVHYKTKINGESLQQLIQEIDLSQGATNP